MKHLMVDLATLPVYGCSIYVSPALIGTAALFVTRSTHQLWEWPGEMYSPCLDWLVQQHRSQAHGHQHQAPRPNRC